jgi:hypothetical protein
LTTPTLDYKEKNMALVKEKYLKRKSFLGYGRVIYEFDGKRYDVFPYIGGGYGVCIDGEHTSTAIHYPDISTDGEAMCIHLELSYEKYQDNLWVGIYAHS